MACPPNQILQSKENEQSICKFNYMDGCQKENGEQKKVRHKKEWFHKHKVQKQPEPLHAVENVQDNSYPWGWKDWEEDRRGFLAAGDVLFLDPGVGYMGVCTLWNP